MKLNTGLFCEKVPNDTDILTDLADVLLWQRKYEESLQVLDRARAICSRGSSDSCAAGQGIELCWAARPKHARNIRRLSSSIREAATPRPVWQDLGGNSRHELRFGNDIDFFSYTDAAQTQSISLISRWNQRWSTVFGTSIYQRFGENAIKFLGSAAYHFTGRDWVNVGSAVANPQGVVPTSEAFFEYGHGFRFENSWVPGLESSYEQHWFWYQGAHVLTLSSTNIVYLPRDWTWALTVIGAHTGFVGTPADWVPSGWTKLGFPLRHRLTGNLFYAVGSEDFSQVDQIGRIATHTYGGGLRYQLAEKQDVTGYVDRQDRTHGQTETSFGLSYGIRF